MIFKVGETEFVKTKFSGLDGKTTVGWSEKNSDFEVRVTQSGVWFQGKMAAPLSTMEELQDFAELTSEAWKEFQRLKPKLATSFKDIPDAVL